MERLGSRRGDLKTWWRMRKAACASTTSFHRVHSLVFTRIFNDDIRHWHIHHIFSHYGLLLKAIPHRLSGVLISNQVGTALAYSLFNLQERGRMLIHPQTEVYEGMIVGIHTRDNDLVVNVCKAKQLTNIRAAGSDENILLIPPIIMTLEQALEFIEDDELVEVTPQSIRVRKKFLKENERKRASK